MEAQIQELPTVDSDGKFHAFRPPEIRSVQAAVEEEMSQHHLTLTCRKCTREETFHGERKAEVIFKARQAGWTYGLDPTGKGSEKASEICPDCPCLRN